MVLEIFFGLMQLSSNNLKKIKEGFSMSLKNKTIIVVIPFFYLPILAVAQDIHNAVKTGDFDEVKQLLDKHPALVYSRDGDKNTPCLSTITRR